jgi:hypothetical protein
MLETGKVDLAQRAFIDHSVAAMRDVRYLPIALPFPIYCGPRGELD